MMEKEKEMEMGMEMEIKTQVINQIKINIQIWIFLKWVISASQKNKCWRLCEKLKKL
jgi:hypothetical protein